MKLKTLLFSGLIATLVSSPVFAYGGHSLFVDEYYTKRDAACDKGGSDVHDVTIVITHNTNANQTYALSACGLNGHSISTQIRMGGEWGKKAVGNGYAQTTSLCKPGNLSATEVHAIDRD